MKPEDVSEEHREYLKMKDNPVKVSNASIFTLLSDGLIKLQERMGILETKHDTTQESMARIEEKVDKNLVATEKKINSLEDDFINCRLKGMTSLGRNDEKVMSLDRMMKGVLALTISIFGLILYLHFGITFP